MTFLSERPLLVSPLLAATIGLEAAVMLQALADRAQAVSPNAPGGPRRLHLGQGELQGLFPFWKAADIRRVEETLKQLGMLAVEPDPRRPGRSCYTLETLETSETPETPERPGMVAGGTAEIPATYATTPDPLVPDPLRSDPLSGIHWRRRLNGQPNGRNGNAPRPIPADWSPSPQCLDALQLAGIDEDYARSKVHEFVLYWRDSGQPRPSWNTVFLQFVRTGWIRLQQQGGQPEYHYGEHQSPAEARQRRIDARLRQYADRSWAE